MNLVQRAADARPLEFYAAEEASARAWGGFLATQYGTNVAPITQREASLSAAGLRLDPSPGVCRICGAPASRGLCSDACRREHRRLIGDTPHVQFERDAGLASGHVAHILVRGGCTLATLDRIAGALGVTTHEIEA
jgi:hypothetical protein